MDRRDYLLIPGHLETYIIRFCWLTKSSFCDGCWHPDSVSVRAALSTSKTAFRMQCMPPTIKANAVGHRVINLTIKRNGIQTYSRHSIISNILD